MLLGYCFCHNVAWTKQDIEKDRLPIVTPVHFLELNLVKTVIKNYNRDRMNYIF